VSKFERGDVVKITIFRTVTEADLQGMPNVFAAGEDGQLYYDSSAELASRPNSAKSEKEI
jgi:hypothetical protein